MLTVRQSQVDSMAKDSPNTPMVAPCSNEATWIEFQLVDQDQNPMPGEEYEVRLPDSSIMQGSLDQDGKVRFASIVPGQAKITFPKIHAKEWAAAGGGDADASS